MPDSRLEELCLERLKNACDRKRNSPLVGTEPLLNECNEKVLS